MKSTSVETLPLEHVERSIHLIRGLKVMLANDLAELYQVEPRALNQAVRRNIERFPADFMFQLTAEEAEALRSQIVILNAAGTSSRGKHSKYRPLAFSEHGVAMLSSVLASKRAIQVNILIVRAFIKLRQLVATHQELVTRIDRVETGQRQQGAALAVVIDEIQRLEQQTPVQTPKRRIGFRPPEEQKAQLRLSKANGHT